LSSNATSLPELALWGTQIGLWDWQVPDDRLTWINDWCALSGLPDFEGQDHETRWTERMHPDDLPSYRAALEKHLAGQTAVLDVEYRLRNRDDRWTWIQERGRVIERDAAGRALRMVGVCLATDERHRAAHALERSESRFELAVSGSDFGFWEIDVETDAVHWWNDWCAEYDIDAGPGLAPRSSQWVDRVHPEDLPQLASYYAMIEGRATLYEGEYRIRTRSGGWRWILSRGRATRRDGSGKVLRVTGVTVDIDARKRAELALIESEARLEAAVWGTDIGLWESDEVGSFRWFNDWCTPLDIDPCDGPQPLEQWRALIHPEDLPAFDRANRESTEGSANHYVVEYRIRTRSDQWRWVHERGRVTARGPNGRSRAAVGVCLDVDARKRTELALRDSEARLETAIWGSDLGLWDWTLTNDTLLWFSDWPRRFGVAVGPTGCRADWLARIHPSDQARHRAEDAALIDGARDSSESDYLALGADGAWRWVNVRTRVIERDVTGRARRIVGACIEVDARRRAEQLLRTQALILETMSEGVILVGTDGRIEFTNPAFDRMFGWNAGELQGRAALDLLNVRRRDKPPALDIERLVKRFNSRTTRRNVSFRRRDGSQFSGEVLSVGIEQHGSRKSLVVVQDVSDRQRLEQEITEAASRERRRLSSDLHDGLGQELTGISLLLRSCANQSDARDRASTAQLEDVIRLVNRAIQTTRTIALGLSLATPARDGFVAALSSLASWSHAHFGVEVQLRLSVPHDLSIEESLASQLYLIAQEAILNAVKHGGAQAIVVSLRVADRLIRLSVTDDGTGLPAQRSPGGGMGLKIMEYRAGMIGGSLSVRNRKSSRGARVRCLCPIGPPPKRVSGPKRAPKSQAQKPQLVPDQQTSGRP
jgi:PAS domain S-box-containing protein